MVSHCYLNSTYLGPIKVELDGPSDVYYHDGADVIKVNDFAVHDAHCQSIGSDAFAVGVYLVVTKGAPAPLADHFVSPRDGQVRCAASDRHSGKPGRLATEHAAALAALAEERAVIVAPTVRRVERHLDAGELAGVGAESIKVVGPSSVAVMLKDKADRSKAGLALLACRYADGTRDVTALVAAPDRLLDRSVRAPRVSRLFGRRHQPDTQRKPRRLLVHARFLKMLPGAVGSLGTVAGAALTNQVPQIGLPLAAAGVLTAALHFYPRVTQTVRDIDRAKLTGDFTNASATTPRSLLGATLVELRPTWNFMDPAQSIEHRRTQLMRAHLAGLQAITRITGDECRAGMSTTQERHARRVALTRTLSDCVIDIRTNLEHPAMIEPDGQCLQSVLGVEQFVKNLAAAQQPSDERA